MKSRLLCVRLTLVTAICLVANAAAATGVRLAYELATPELVDALRDTRGLAVSPDGRHLYSGNLGTTNRVSVFNLDDDGAPAFSRTYTTGDAGFAGTSNVRDLAMGATGDFVYAGGASGLAVLRRDPQSGELTHVQNVALEFVQDIAMHPNGGELIAVTSDALEGSSFNRYRIDAVSGELASAQAVTYTEDPSYQLREVTLAPDGSQAFVGTPADLLVYSRLPSGDFDIPERTNIGDREFLGVRAVASSDGQSLFVLDRENSKLVNFARDSVTGALTELQSFQSSVPPLFALTMARPQDLVLSGDGNTLFVSSIVYLRTSINIGAIACVTSFARDPGTGLVVFSGDVCRGRAGPDIVLHPQKALAYSAFPTIDQLLGDPTPGAIGVYAPDAVLPRTSVVAAVLPTGRVEGNRFMRTSPVTAFATMLNTSQQDAADCVVDIAPDSPVDVSIQFWETDPVTNFILPGSSADDPFTVSGGGATTLTFSVSNRQGNFDPTLLEFAFYCLNADPAPVVPGVNTLLLSASELPLPDLVTATATVDNNGTVTLPESDGLSFFSVATVNIGGADSVRAVPVVDMATLVPNLAPLAMPPRVTLTICETDPTTSLCVSDIDAETSRMFEADEIATYAVFVRGQGEDVAFRPETNRAFILFVDSAGKVRGGSSVAIQTAP